MVKDKINIAVLISGTGTNLRNIILYAQNNAEVHYQVSLVISNKADALGLNHAQKYSILHKIIDHMEFKSREEFDQRIDQELEKSNIELVVLAGFMRILSKDFVEKWQGRIVNIHPSLLPKYKGAEAVRDALMAHEKETGCTVHYVTPMLDSGEIIAQKKVRILPSDDVSSLHQRIKEQEAVIYPESIERISQKLLKKECL